MENQAEQQEQKPKQPPPPPPEAVVKESKPTAAEKPLIWDCGSSLYDSFELKSFEKQLDSAIHSRSLSMPHLSDRTVFNILDPKPPPQPPLPQPAKPKKPSKISRSILRLLRSMFKPKQQQEGSYNAAATAFSPKKEPNRNEFYVVYDYDKSGVLSTIPEVPELDNHSPDINSFVKRAASDRFLFTPIGISCA